MYANLSNKVNLIWQRHCQICEVQYPVELFSIRLTPISFRTDKKTRKAYYIAIESRFSKKAPTLFKKTKLCLSVTFVINRKRSAIDVDNMTKIFLDSLHSFVFDNDSQVEHLDTVKFMSDDNDEFILFRVMQTNINTHIDVEDKKFSHDWAGAIQLKIDDFIDSTP